MNMREGMRKKHYRLSHKKDIRVMEKFDHGFRLNFSITQTKR